MSLTKVTYVPGTTIITSANMNDIQQNIINGTGYATCATAAATVAKVASLTDFVLSTGARIVVKFTYSNTASSPTLNVNGTGAKAIKRYGTTAVGTNPSTSWVAGEAVELVYDGTNWVIVRGTAYGNVASLTYTDIGAF